jgi:hypothetical protein
MEHKITIGTENLLLIQQILNLIKDEQATFQLDQSIANNRVDLAKVMNEISAKGIIKSIKDPLTWQKEMRKDKKLFGRD